MVESNFIECNSIESFEDNSIDTSNLNNQQFSPIKISEIDDYFIAEIKETELILSKYISFFDYFDKVVVFLSSALSLAFSLCTGLVKKLLKATRNKKKKHNKIVI